MRDAFKAAKEVTINLYVKVGFYLLSATRLRSVTQDLYYQTQGSTQYLTKSISRVVLDRSLLYATKEVLTVLVFDLYDLNLGINANAPVIATSKLRIGKIGV